MSPIDALAWSGNAAFFTRFLLQWRCSERAGRPVAPAAFFWISLYGALALLTYAFHVGEPVMLAGYALTGLIYARNLGLQRSGSALPPEIALLLGVLALGGLVSLEAFELRDLHADTLPWLAVGAVGQLVWSSRFALQWWASEREGACLFPRSFWWISLAGNTLLLAYALHLQDAKFIAGFAIGPFVQIRNLMLAYRSAPSGGLRRHATQ